jgi:ubiquinone biosynthesis monooxygenase Coq7
MKLPGDLSHKERLAQIIRVNHAGEYGARRIYQGQLAVLGKSSVGDTLRHMAEQEEEHLAEFSRLAVEKRVRPTLLMPLWHVGAFAMGAATALMGKEAAMACTVAVESVIDEHYAKQEEELAQSEPELKETISKFRADEREHHDTALDNGAQRSPFYAAVTEIVKAQTKLAIWFSTRI